MTPKRQVVLVAAATFLVISVVNVLSVCTATYRSNGRTMIALRVLLIVPSIAFQRIILVGQVSSDRCPRKLTKHNSKFL